MNGVIYARYSSDNQREESIEGQLRECKEYAEKNSILIVGTYIDRAFSAKTDHRPQFQQMIQDSKKGLFDTILVWKLDRFSRNRYDSAYYKRILKNNKVQIISVTEPISSTPEGIMLESLLEGMAEYYSAELGEKVSRGLKENALKARFNGGYVPLGYRIDDERHYQIDPVTAPVVQEVFRRYADGEGIKQLCHELNERGVRTSLGRCFTKCSFQNMLKNRRYLGEYRYKDVVIDNAVPALIDAETFERVQQRSQQNQIAPVRVRAEVPFILTSKVFCGKCGAMVAGDSGTSKTGTVHYYYKCGNRKRGGKETCSLKAVRKEWLEHAVTYVAVTYVQRDEITERIVSLAMESSAKENPRLPALRGQLRDVNRRISNLISAVEEGFISDSSKQRLDELEKRRRELEASIGQEELKHPKLEHDQIVFWLSQFKHLDLENVRVQKQIVDCFVNTVYLFDDQLVANFNFDRERRKISLAEVETKLEDAPLKVGTASKQMEPDLFFYGDGFGVMLYYSDISLL